MTHAERIDKLWAQLERTIKALRTNQDAATAHALADVARTLAGALKDAEGE